jgi:hypothetical protein
MFSSDGNLKRSEFIPGFYGDDAYPLWPDGFKEANAPSSVSVIPNKFLFRFHAFLLVINFSLNTTIIPKAFLRTGEWASIHAGFRPLTFPNTDNKKA